MQRGGGKFGHGRMNISAMAVSKKKTAKNDIFPNFPQIKAFLQQNILCYLFINGSKPIFYCLICVQVSKTYYKQIAHGSMFLEGKFSNFSNLLPVNFPVNSLPVFLPMAMAEMFILPWPNFPPLIIIIIWVDWVSCFTLTRGSDYQAMAECCFSSGCELKHRWRTQTQKKKNKPGSTY